MASSTAQKDDPAFALWAAWHRAQHASLVLCRVQQRLETRITGNTGIQVLTSEKPRAHHTPARKLDAVRHYALAREAEVLAMTEVLKFQDALPEVSAVSLAGIMAKLDMIIGADRDIGDPTDFPWPHIASVLRDLKAIAGDLPAYRRSRPATRADIGRHWEDAAKLVTCFEAEEAAE